MVALQVAGDGLTSADRDTVRIAFTHNLSLSNSEEHAEFDTPTTVRLITEALERLGHEVRPIEVSAPVGTTIGRLERYRPDLVFNTAEGQRGRLREAFFPALFEELRIPYTGAGPYSLALTLDKQLTKLVVAQHGIRTPAGQYLTAIEQLRPDELRYPVIVKPNFEGSSKGISSDSIVDDRDALTRQAAAALRRYPDGILVEEFIAGTDVTVPYLEAVPGSYGGVLSAVDYRFGGEAAAAGRTLYDYARKSVSSASVSVHAPAALDPRQTDAIREMTRTAVRVLEIRDLGRVDFRLSLDGQLFFLEANALPSMEPGAGLYAAAALEGLDTTERVFAAVVESAVRRWGITGGSARASRGSSRRSRKGALRVGFTYNEKRLPPDPAGGNDAEAEFDSPEVLQAVREAIAADGHRIVDLEATAGLPAKLASASVDVVFNIAEGAAGRGRELHVPALLEMLRISFTGSDSVAMALSLDKSVAKHVVAGAGVRTPAHAVLTDWRRPIPPALLQGPVVVKPIAEGTSKGVMRHSVVSGEAAIREAACAIITKYQQPALVETYLPGREFTVGLLGYPQPRVLPPMEILFLDPALEHPVYSFDTKQRQNGTIGYQIPAALTDGERRVLEAAALTVFEALGCRDMTRVDFRMDALGELNFLECNPLPGLAPGWSDYVLIADAAGVSYPSLINEILAGAIRRRADSSGPPHG